MGTEEVSVRELRQNLSVHLRRVRDGRTLAVTSRGERVAILSPIDGGSRLERLIAEGRVTPPAEPGPIEVPPPGPALTPALLAERDEDRR
jgi:prevent-host-death family protein